MAEPNSGPTVADLFRRAQAIRKENAQTSYRDLSTQLVREFSGGPFPPTYNLTIPEQDARAPEEDWTAGLPLVLRGIQQKDWNDIAQGIVLSLEQTENYESQRGGEGTRDALARSDARNQRRDGKRCRPLDARRPGEIGRAKQSEQAMTKKTVFLGGVFLMLSFAGASYAQTATPSPTPTPTPECPDSAVPKTAELDKRLRITDKPNPKFDHDEMRKHQNGVITLRALFCGATGKVTNIKVLKGLSGKLDEEAIKAARKIQFVPAEKDGQKTSQWLYLDYYIRVH